MCSVLKGGGAHKHLTSNPVRWAARIAKALSYSATSLHRALYTPRLTQNTVLLVIYAVNARLCAACSCATRPQVPFPVPTPTPVPIPTPTPVPVPVPTPVPVRVGCQPAAACETFHADDLGTSEWVVVGMCYWLRCFSRGHLLNLTLAAQGVADLGGPAMSDIDA